MVEENEALKKDLTKIKDFVCAQALLEAQVCVCMHVCMLLEICGAVLVYPSCVHSSFCLKQHKREDDQWFSPSFYSHIRGYYKICISIYAFWYHT